MSNLHYVFNFVLLLVLLLMQNPTTTMCRTTGMQPRHSSVISSTTNMTRIQFSEQQFMKWIKFVGGLRHSVFGIAKNKLFPSYTLHVTKKPSHGQFSTIQGAIDSLPFLNLVRVVIKVHAGAYTSVTFLHYMFIIPFQHFTEQSSLLLF